MTVISGQHAYIDTVPCIAQWQVSETADLQTYAASCTGGGTGVTDGNIDWAGSANGIGHSPILMPTGVDFSFKGVADNAAGDAIVYDGTIVVTQTTINIPIAAGGPITWAAVFGARGALTEGTVGAADATTAEAPSAKLAGIKIAAEHADLAAAALLADVQSVTLTFTRPPSQYVSGGFGNRLAGNLGCTVSFNILHRSLVNALYNLNVFNALAVYVNASEYYSLPIKWAAKSNFVVDVASRAPVGYTVNGVWGAVVPVALDDDGGGWIKKPDNSYFFGAAPVVT